MADNESFGAKIRPYIIPPTFIAPTKPALVIPQNFAVAVVSQPENLLQLTQTFALNKLETLLYIKGMPAPIIKGSENINYSTQFGKPVISDLSTDAGSWTDTSTGAVNVFPALKIPLVIFTVTPSKIIIKTSIQGRSGTVKEYISSGDTKINVKGRIDGANGVYPHDQVNDLIKVLNAPISLSVRSWFLNQFDVHNIVIDGEPQLPQTEGGYSYQTFEFDCLSDLPFEILVKG